MRRVVAVSAALLAVVAIFSRGEPPGAAHALDDAAPTSSVSMVVSFCSVKNVTQDQRNRPPTDGALVDWWYLAVGAGNPLNLQWVSTRVDNLRVSIRPTESKVDGEIKLSFFQFEYVTRTRRKIVGLMQFDGRYVTATKGVAIQLDYVFPQGLGMPAGSYVDVDCNFERDTWMSANGANIGWDTSHR